jgi:hypothetical protein
MGHKLITDQQAGVLEGLKVQFGEAMGAILVHIGHRGKPFFLISHLNGPLRFKVGCYVRKGILMNSDAERNTIT